MCWRQVPIVAIAMYGSKFHYMDITKVQSNDHGTGTGIPDSASNQSVLDSAQI